MLNFAQFINDNTDFSASKKQEMLDKFCGQYNYQEEIEDENGDMIPNPVTKVQFFNEKVEEFIRQTINAKKHTEARETARDGVVEFTFE